MGYKQELYTKHYYENLVLGAKEWKEGGIRIEHANLLEGMEGKHVLDIGCGRGDALRYCLVQGAESVTGVDFSPDAIALATETLEDYVSAELHAGDALDILPKLTDRYDVILMLDSIEHIPAGEIDDILNQVSRLLAPGGRLIVDTPYYKRYEDYVKQGDYVLPSPTDKNPLTIGMHCTKYTKGRLLDLLMNHGFIGEDNYFEKLEPKDHIVCAYYTENTPYEAEIAHLRDSLIKHRVPYYFKPIPTLSKWEWNCGMKPTFIRECLDRFTGRTIMYTDADSVFMGYPDYLDEFSNQDADLAIKHLGKELLTGTIIFKDNAKVRKLVENWIYEQSLTPSEWDQKVLQRILGTQDVEIADLPLEYIQIFDHATQCENPIVVHNQASRRLKNSVAVSTTAEVYLPSWVKGARILANGCIALLREDRRSIKYLDNMFCRVPGELKWWPVAANKDAIASIAGIHKCEITIVGKGPSLDRLTLEHLTGPVIAINEAFNTVQALGAKVVYGTQLDSWMKDACKPVQGTLFCSARSQVHYVGNKKVKLIEPMQLGLPATPCSLEYSMAIAAKMGATHIKLMCFDALVTGDCNYAEAIGYTPTNMGDPKRFLKQVNVPSKCKVPYTLELPE